MDQPNNSNSTLGFLIVAIAMIAIIVLCRSCNNNTPPQNIKVLLTPINSGPIGEKDDPLIEQTFLGFYEYETKFTAWTEDSLGNRGHVEYIPESFVIWSDHDIDELEKYCLHKDEGYFYTSQEQVEKFCIGKRLEDIERRWRPAHFISNYQNSKNGKIKPVAVFSDVAALSSYGTFSSFAVSFNEDGVCDEVKVPYKRIKDTNSFMLSLLPYAQTIAGWDWLMWNVQEPLYQSSHSNWSWYIRWPYKIISFFWTYLVWPFFIVLIPLWLILGCLRFGFMRFVPNKVIFTFVTIVTLVWSYVWMVAILCWGYWWIFYIPLLFITVLLGFGSVRAFLYGDGKRPGVRCQKCGRVDSYKFVRKDNERKEILIKRASQRISSSDYIDQNSMKTYRCTYRRYMNTSFGEETACGSETFIEKRYQKYTHYEYKDWKDYYDIVKADVTERCTCGEERLIKDKIIQETFNHREDGGTHSEDVPFNNETVEGGPQGTKYRYELVNSIEI